MSDFSGFPRPAPLSKTQAVGLIGLVDHARSYARASHADNTRRAYDLDWRAFEAWAGRHGLSVAPPSPEVIGLFLTACATGDLDRPLSVSTIERRLSAIVWRYAQDGFLVSRNDPHIGTVLAGIRRTHGRPPRQKEALLSDDIRAMLGLLSVGDLRGLRDRALILVGFAGGLRRSELVGLDLGDGQTDDALGWVEFLPEGLLVRVRGKTGWREIEIGRGSDSSTCPVETLRQWVDYARISHGPIFRRIGRRQRLMVDRLNDRHVARLIKDLTARAGIRSDLTIGQRREAFSGHSLRAGLASSAAVDERFVQKHLGHASPVMTRRYQRRRDRFRINMTTAAGL